MKTIKNAFVTLVMLAVVYGVWVMLNKKPIAPPPGFADQQMWQPPQLEFGQTPPQPVAGGNGTLQPPQVTTPGDWAGQSQPAAPVVSYPSAPGGSSPAAQQFASPPPFGHPGGDAGASPAHDGHATGPPTMREDQYASASSRAATSGAGPAEDAPEASRYARSSSFSGADAQLAGSQFAADAAENAMAATAEADVAPGDYAGFMAAWRGAQDQLREGQLADALFTLSLWYGSRDVPPEMESQLVDLLDQLAGAVVYNREYALEQPHVVRAGEKIADIAAQYQVPWQLLANINGIDASRPLEPGTQLKVLQGPFDAVVSLDRKELTLMLDRRYAGRFAINLGNDPQPMTGEYLVREKNEEQTFYDRDGRAIPPGGSENPYGPYWIGLGGRLGIHGAPVPGQRESTGSIVVVDPGDARDLYAILSPESRVIIRR